MKLSHSRCFTYLGIVSLLAFAVVPIHASLVQVASAAGLPAINDGISWASLGGDLTALSPPVALTTTAAHGATLSGSTAFTLFLGSTFNADFLPGDTVVSAFDINSVTPLSSGIQIDLQTLAIGFGAQVQEGSAFGAFSATLQAFDSSSVSLGSVTVNSSVGGNGDGSAVFLGAYSTGNPIARVLVTSNLAGVAIDTVSLDDVVTTSLSPEPASFVLGFSAIGALALLRRKRA
jgi:hypothetical protein